MDHEFYMQHALKEAQKAYEADEVPIGAVIVMRDKVIAGLTIRWKNLMIQQRMQKLLPLHLLIIFLVQSICRRRHCL